MAQLRRVARLAALGKGPARIAQEMALSPRLVSYILADPRCEEEVRKLLTFHTVNTLDEVFSIALMEAPAAKPPADPTMMEQMEQTTAGKRPSFNACSVARRTSRATLPWWARANPSSSFRLAVIRSTDRRLLAKMIVERCRRISSPSSR